ncbi:response regulator [Rhizobium sp. P40RR-XXII]|uniref:response regulator n=1 Tax=Rhizobium sp. P40RR-XXII TaxID=2726739 RepID=UPI001456A940|nr:response regulator [Rhizobium sp. P40RR-XXII]NLS19084.1 response regulator [Rhizobium sp. P40RR-XXII]
MQRVLIVEDDPLIAIDLQHMIHDLGYVTSGIANSFDSAKRLAPHSDLALVDVNLVDGATGPRIGQFLAGEFGISVVMVTANPEVVADGIFGVIGVISKPAQPATIKQVLEFMSTYKHQLVAHPPALRLFTCDRRGPL